MSDNDLGFSEHSDPNEPTIAQEPIVLPAPQGQQSYLQPQQQFPSVQHMAGNPQSSRPSNPLARISHLWKNDPAYRFLFIAISAMLISSVICAALLAGVFHRSTSQSAQRGGPNTQQTANARGINTSTPMPTPTLTPTPTPTPMPTPTPTPTVVQLTVEITNKIPNPVQEGATVPVDVKTSTSGVTVHLSIIYIRNRQQTTGQTQDQSTDGQGNATISWSVPLFLPGATVTAQVIAIAQDQQGNQVKSQTVTVNVNTF